MGMTLAFICGILDVFFLWRDSQVAMVLRYSAGCLGPIAAVVWIGPRKLRNALWYLDWRLFQNKSVDAGDAEEANARTVEGDATMDADQCLRRSAAEEFPFLLYMKVVDDLPLPDLLELEWDDVREQLSGGSYLLHDRTRIKRWHTKVRSSKAVVQQLQCNRGSSAGLAEAEPTPVDKLPPLDLNPLVAQKPAVPMAVSKPPPSAEPLPCTPVASVQDIAATPQVEDVSI